MILLICVDDFGGMMFNRRRQSQDRVLRARMLEMAKGTKLHVTPYTQRQFDPDAPLVVSDTPWLMAGKGEYYFAEDGEIPVARAEQVIVFRWNRHYPSDRTFGYDLTAEGFTLQSSEEFAGYSHECITQEIYRKESNE